MTACNPNGAVVSAFLSASIDGDTIIGWLESSAFSVREVQTDGSLSELDFRAAALAMHADEVDNEAKRLGAIGITSLIAGRRVREQNTGGLTSELREAAFERRHDPNTGPTSRPFRCGRSSVGLLTPTKRP